MEPSKNENGKTSVHASPLAGWLLLQAHGCMLLGKPIGGDSTKKRITLSPVYELHPQVQTQPTPAGMQVALGHLVLPLWCCKSITALDVPVDAIGVCIDTLDEGDRLSLANAVSNCETLIAAMVQPPAPPVIAFGGSIDQAKAEAAMRTTLDKALRGKH